MVKCVVLVLMLSLLNPNRNPSDHINPCRKTQSRGGNLYPGKQYLHINPFQLQHQQLSNSRKTIDPYPTDLVLLLHRRSNINLIFNINTGMSLPRNNTGLKLTVILRTMVIWDLICLSLNNLLPCIQVLHILLQSKNLAMKRNLKIYRTILLPDPTYLHHHHHNPTDTKILHQITKFPAKKNLGESGMELSRN
ncbi:uncharacterized protein Dwil_GK18183 [Drosophila willistoni]|uniref:Uncharacterized protein n=1 Tax=Drosophila willistoni TaxID=7260 RepID=B4MYR8_DROWI|nr:uncharacterized protein Dwil_GK18183 [Drosophila willistoni]